MKITQSLLALLFSLYLMQSASAAQFIYSYAKPQNPQLQPVYELTQRLQMLEILAQNWNSRIKLPKSLMMMTQECGQANAFYSPEHHRMVLCYELIASILNSGTDDAKPQALVENMFGVVMFVTAHEMGHAVIDMLELPVLGGEEIAADQFAVLSFLDNENQWPTEQRKQYWDLLASGATQLAMAEQGNNKLKHLLDKHLLSGQRFYNALCLMYGYDPAANTRFMAALQQRAQSCPSEYQAARKAWGLLLKPYWRS